MHNCCKGIAKRKIELGVLVIGRLKRRLASPSGRRGHQDRLDKELPAAGEGHQERQAQGAGAIQGDELASPQEARRPEEVIAYVKALDIEQPLQFSNSRLKILAKSGFAVFARTSARKPEQVSLSAAATARLEHDPPEWVSVLRRVCSASKRASRSWGRRAYRCKLIWYGAGCVAKRLRADVGVRTCRFWRRQGRDAAASGPEAAGKDRGAPPLPARIFASEG